MTLVTIDLGDVAGGHDPDDYVIIRAEAFRESRGGGVTSTAEVKIPLVNGVGQSEVEPGPVVVTFRCQAVADTREKRGVVPDSGTVGIEEVIASSLTWTPVMADRIQEWYEQLREDFAWWKGNLPNNSNLNTLTTRGTWSVTTHSGAQTIINGPGGVAQSTGDIQVRTPGERVIQMWTTARSGGLPPIRFERIRSAGVWSAWSQVTDAETVAAAVADRWQSRTATTGMNADTFPAGVVHVPTGAVARSIIGRPAGFQSVGVYETLPTNGGASFQRAMTYSSLGTPRTWIRQTQDGVYLPWVETTADLDDGPGFAPERVVFWGDSAVAGNDANGNWTAAETLPARVGALIGTPTVNNGFGGQRSNDVLLHAGVHQLMGTPAGGVIPASGEVEVLTNGGPYIGSSAVKRFSVTWAEVPGSLRKSGAQFFFTRSAAGTAVPVATPMPLSATDGVRLSDVNIFLMGGNDHDASETSPDADKTAMSLSNYIRAVEAVPDRRVLIGGLKTRRETVHGDANHKYVQAVNNELRTLFPHLFVDRQRWLVERGLAVQGYTPTGAELAQMEAGIIPGRVFADGDPTHVKKQVVQAEARELWAPALVNRGWSALRSGAVLSPWVPPAFEPRVPVGAVAGTGTPEGRIAATVGTVYTDTAATNGAIRWIKASGTGTTGWKVEYGDTGRRNVSDALPDGWVGSIFVSRRGAEITLAGSNLRPPSEGDVILVNLPSGFRPTNSEVGVASEDNVLRSVFAFSYSPFVVRARGIIKAQSWVNFSMSFFTNDQWPTSLPGTPA